MSGFPNVVGHGAPPLNLGHCYLNKPGLSLVANRQDHHSVALDAVAGEVTTVAKLNHPLPIGIWHVRCQPAAVRVLAQHLDGLDDGGGGALGGDGTVLMEEILDPLQVTDSG